MKPEGGASGRVGLLIPGPDVGADAQQSQQGGQHVLARRDPGNGFDAQGVEGPEGGEEKRAPGFLAEGEEQQIQRHGVERVEEHVGEVESPRIGGRSKKPEVEQIGNPQQGHVHAFVAVKPGECAPQCTPGKSVEDDGIVDDEHRVVEVDEREGSCRKKQRERGGEKQQGKQQDLESSGFHGAGFSLVTGRPLPNCRAIRREKAFSR
ncbi:MAG: hypothetical protein EOM10_04415 [Opitutae bacterium]|nr:hypothetical protein [Opitutae bacterium]